MLLDCPVDWAVLAPMPASSSATATKFFITPGLCSCMGLPPSPVQAIVPAVQWLYRSLPCTACCCSPAPVTSSRKAQPTVHVMGKVLLAGAVQAYSVVSNEAFVTAKRSQQGCRPRAALWEH